MFLLQIMTRGSFGTPREGNRILDDEERKARWMNDSFPEFHNDDALWGYVIRAERQYQIWQHSDIKDVPFLRLLAMGEGASTSYSGHSLPGGSRIKDVPQDPQD